MTRLILTAAMCVSLGSYLTLWMLQPQAARDVGLVYVAFVGTANIALHLMGRANG